MSLALSGRAAYPTVMIRLVKNLEIGIMALAAFGFWNSNVTVLLACTFLMGLHSSLFGPVKFALLPHGRCCVPRGFIAFDEALP